MLDFRLSLGEVCFGDRNPRCRRIPHNQNARMHWAEKNRWNQAWYDAVWWAWKEATGKSPPKLPLHYPQITYTFFQIRQMDFDGMWGASKVLTDGLVRAGIIRNDSPADIPQPLLRQSRVLHLRHERVEIQLGVPEPSSSL